MPLQRRLPKIGFRSAMKASRAELTLSDLMRVSGAEVTLAGLIEANLVSENTKLVKIIFVRQSYQAVHHQRQSYHRDQGRQERR